MNKTLLRASTALLIAIAASVGVPQKTNSIQASLTPEVNPAVLSAQSEATPAAELSSTISASASTAPNATAEATSSANPEILAEVISEVTASVAPAPLPMASFVPTPIPSATPGPDGYTKEQKIAKLTTFLAKYKSPLTNEAAHFVESAELYNIDWKLVPSITGVESTFGKFLIPNSYNAYGWGGGRIMFNSWKESIYHVSMKLSEKYVQKGLTTPHLMQRVYAPPSKTWGDKVTFFMNKLEATEASPSPTPQQ
jgi:hypothetical protein